MRKIVLKCKCCGNTIGTFTFEKRLDYGLKCKKCKYKNIGTITEHKKKSSE